MNQQSRPMKFSLSWIIMLVLSVMAGLFYMSVKSESESWEKFKVEHKCQKTKVIHGQYLQDSPPYEGWLCDDGAIHVR